MKKIIPFLLCFAIIFSFTSCTKKSKPKNICDDFCKSMISFDFESMAKLTATKNSIESKVLSKNRLTSSKLTEFYKLNAQKITYEIAYCEVNDKKAEVSVMFLYNDAKEATENSQAEYYLDIVGKLFTGESKTRGDIFYGIFEKNLKNTSSVNNSVTVQFSLTKIDSKWLIDKTPDEIIDIMSCNMYRTICNMTIEN